MNKQECLLEVTDLSQINRCINLLKEVDPSILKLANILKLAENDVRLKIFFLLSRYDSFFFHRCIYKEMSFILVLLFIFYGNLTAQDTSPNYFDITLMQNASPRISQALSESNSFPERWIDGTSENEPAFQIHEFGPGTWIIRQSLTKHFEAPFIYVIKGSQKALLFDTGATTEPWLRELIDEILGNEFPLVVAHSHAHSDHVAGDEEFISRPNTHIVGHTSEEVADFFEISDWPSNANEFDLGQRKLLVIPIPGHEPSSIAVYDIVTGILLMGDTLYPGRLYVQDTKTYKASINRVVDLLENEFVSWVLGAHIEMTNQPGQDYGPLQPKHPNERKLQLKWEHVLQLQQALESMGDKAEYAVFDDFIIYPIY